MSMIDAAGSQRGIALLGVLVILALMSLMGATLLNLAGQEIISANVGREAAIAQQLADAAGELVVGWFHRPRAAPPAIPAVMAKQHQTVEGWPSYFDQAGRSQFVGTAEHPDQPADEAGGVGIVHHHVTDDPGLAAGHRHLDDALDRLDAIRRQDRDAIAVSDRLHVVERYTMIDADTIHYQARIEDPQVYSRPWTMVSALLRNKEQGFEMLEQACHEGNYSVENSLTIGLKPYRGVVPPGK